MATTQQVDIAIVGAGIAGCYAAYRLLEASNYATLPAQSPLRQLLAGRNRLTIGLYEQDSRVGGRIKSMLTAAGTAELGAMRFHYRHRLVRRLLARFQLNSAVMDFEQERLENFVCLRGQTLRRGAIGRTSLPYNLPVGEKNVHPNDLVDRAITQVLPGFLRLRGHYHASLQARQWQAARQLMAAYAQSCRTARVGNLPLTSATWADLLRTGLSAEALNLVEAYDGYEAMESNGGAVGWLDTLFHIPPGVQWQCLATGFEKLVQALHHAYEAGGGQTHYEHRLTAIKRHTADAPYALEFASKAGKQLVQAKLVLLSLPKPALEQLNQGGFVPQLPLVSAGLAGLISVDACKIFLEYSQAWWAQQGLTAGRSTTDSPLRQVYYYPSTPTSQGALLMAAYCNGPDVRFWQELRGEPAILGQVAHALVGRMHRVSLVPPPHEVHTQFWLAEEGTPGWHVQGQGRPNPDRGVVANPSSAGQAIHLIGEGWSREPGSVEGALQSAEHVLVQQLKLGNPAGTGPRRVDSLTFLGQVI